MKVKMNFYEITEIKHTYIPFKIEIKGQLYTGNFEIIETKINHLFLEDKDYSITWDEEEPEGMDEDKIIDILIKEMQKKKRI